MELPKPLKNRWVLRGLLTVLGAAGGYAYYAYVGCLTGSCPISSNPWLMTSYGGLMGLTLGPWGKQKLSDPLKKG